MSCKEAIVLDMKIGGKSDDDDSRRELEAGEKLTFRKNTYIFNFFKKINRKVKSLKH